MLTEWKGVSLVPLEGNEPLRTGDRIVIRFQWIIEGTWLRAYEWGQIEKLLEGRSDWRVLSYRNEGDFLDAEIEVLQGSSPAMAGGIFQTPASSGNVFQTSLAPVVGAAIIAASIAIIFVSVRYGLRDTLQYYRRVDDVRLVEEGIASPSILSPPPSLVESAKWPVIALAVAAVIIFGLPKLK